MARPVSTHAMRSGRRGSASDASREELAALKTQLASLTEELARLKKDLLHVRQDRDRMRDKVDATEQALGRESEVVQRLTFEVRLLVVASLVPVLGVCDD